MAPILTITGRGLPLRGGDLDTDRIMPARFLRAVTFEGLERHLFEDDRAADPSHPFNNPSYTGATILIVNNNFGCGSSREHAPQGLARYGIRAIVGESYSEIFLGNSAVLGIPCFTADQASIEALLSLVEREPRPGLRHESRRASSQPGGSRFKPGCRRRCGMPSSAASGIRPRCSWTFDQVRAVAARLPYVNGF